MAKKYIQLYYDYLDAIELLGDAERGRLFTALLEYGRTGATQGLSGNERFLFPMMRAQIDRDNKEYEEKSRKNSDNVSKRYDRIQPNTNSTTEYERSQEEDKDKDKEEEIICADALPPTDGDHSAESEKHKHGEYGWVLLTDAEYGRLEKDWGIDKLSYYITYVDEFAQKTKNKNKYKDWNLVLRNAVRDNWGNYAPKSAPKTSKTYYG